MKECVAVARSFLVEVHRSFGFLNFLQGEIVKRFRMSIIGAIALLAPAVAYAGAPVCDNSAPNPFANLTPRSGPAVLICAGGTFFSFTNFSTDGKLRILPGTKLNLAGGASISLSATFNSDPFISFAFQSILPSGFGPLPFDALFLTPVVGGPYDNATSVGALGLTETGVGATTGTVSQGSLPNYITGFADATDLNVGTGTGTCSVSTPPASSSTTCNPPGKSNNFAPITPSNLSARLSYKQNSTGVEGISTASWSGTVTLNAVTTTAPEPTTVALMFVGLAIVGGAGYRRNRHV
ncbi:MAG: PEP-CTERM sorting domain-containing protein [Dokdonella sp.]